MQFSEILSSVASAGDSQFRITVTDDWGQGRATFGGLIAAAGNEAMRRLVASDRWGWSGWWDRTPRDQIYEAPTVHMTHHGYSNDPETIHSARPAPGAHVHPL